MRRFLHGITAAVGVLVVGVGVPLMLVRLAGWPLPTKMPDWNNVYWSARQQHVPAEFVIKTFAVIAWLAWAQLMWAVVWELAVNVPRTVRGQRAVAAPGTFGVAARAARALVAPLMLLSTLTSSSSAAAAPALADLSSTAWFGPTHAPRAAATVVEREAARDLPVWVVDTGDTLWDIAERCLGDGSRVDELLACNQGLTATSRIRPGDHIRLPAGSPVPPDRAPRAEPDVAASDSHVATYVVERGDSLWEIADEQLDDPLRWPEVFEANEGRTFADGRSFDDPDLIQPGWDLLIPDRPEREPTEPAPTEQPPPEQPEPDPEPPDPDTEPTLPGEPVTSPDAPSVPDEPTTPDDPSEANDGDPDPSVPPTTPSRAVATSGEQLAPPAAAPAPDTAPPQIFPPPGRAPDTVGARPLAEPDLRPVNRWSDVTVPAHDPAADEAAADDAAAPELLTMERAAMLSAGVLLLLAVRRRQRLRSAPAGARPPAPNPSVASTEKTLRSVGAAERFARVDLAVRAAAMALIGHGQRPLAVLAAPDGTLELVPTGPAELDPPWERQAERWVLPANVPIEMLAPDARNVAVAPTPAMVQLGCDGPREVYVDLEAVGALQIDAEPAVGDAIIAAIATTLATSVLAEVTTLIGVDVPAEAFCGQRLYAPATDVPDALATAAEAVGSTVVASAPTFELRARATGGEAWEPAIVLVGSGVGDTPLPYVPRGVAVVSAAPIVGPSALLAPEGDGWVLRPAGIRITPIGLDPTTLAAVDELLDVPLAQPSDALTELAAPLPADPTPYAVLVRVMGPVRIETAMGDAIAFERGKTRELVAWLATHRERSTRTLARTALWELDVRDATFANVVSEARRALARAVAPPEGEEWVARTLTEDLPLHELVRTDAELLMQALESARLAPPDEAIAILRPAVDLLTGMPFEGTSYLWPDAEGITSSLVVLATTAAAELAAHCLATGDVEGVFAATERGLRVLPGHEELVGLRMRAHALAGDRAGVRHEWESYSRTLLADPWSDGEPSPKLVSLRAELLGGTPS